MSQALIPSVLIRLINSYLPDELSEYDESVSIQKRKSTSNVDSIESIEADKIIKKLKK